MRNVTYKDLLDLACHSDKGNTENCSSNIPFSKASNKKDTKTSSKHIKVSRIDHYSSKHGGTSKSKISKSGRLGSRGKCMWHLLKPPVCQVALFDQVQLSPLNTDACYISHLYSSFHWSCRFEFSLRIPLFIQFQSSPGKRALKKLRTVTSWPSSAAARAARSIMCLWPPHLRDEVHFLPTHAF